MIEMDDSGENKLSFFSAMFYFRIKLGMLRSARNFSKNDISLFKGLKSCQTPITHWQHLSND